MVWVLMWLIMWIVLLGDRRYDLVQEVLVGRYCGIQFLFIDVLFGKREVFYLVFEVVGFLQLFFVIVCIFRMFLVWLQRVRWVFREGEILGLGRVVLIGDLIGIKSCILQVRREMLIFGSREKKRRVFVGYLILEKGKFGFVIDFGLISFLVLEGIKVQVLFFIFCDWNWLYL